MGQPLMTMKIYLFPQVWLATKYVLSITDMRDTIFTGMNRLYLNPFVVCDFF